VRLGVRGLSRMTKEALAAAIARANDRATAAARWRPTGCRR
jgi:hypothetical protein